MKGLLFFLTLKGGKMTLERIAMSAKEIDRLLVIEKVVGKRIKQIEGAKQLGISKRQMIRLVNHYRQEGAVGLVSRHRGHPSNRCCKEEVKLKVKELVHRYYSDFGPTLVMEKLSVRHEIELSKETLRQWMIEWELWEGKKQRKVRVHQSRARRPCLGELVQIDGSPHDWFEGRGPYCCLLVFVDDATSKLLQLRFELSETTEGYFKSTRSYIERYGRPVSFYSDKDSIFRINTREGSGLTQFGRAMQELGIGHICAHSPQAKGRVERANGILQDRLVKEMRLAGINSIEQANAFLPGFVEAYNEKFAKPPASEVDAHRRELPCKEVLDRIFSYQEERTLSKNLELSYKTVIYQVQGAGKGYRLRNTKITVCEGLDGDITLLNGAQVLSYKVLEKRTPPVKVVASKEINEILTRQAVNIHKPAPDHPWRRYKSGYVVPCGA